jgi:hypothetical protein
MRVGLIDDVISRLSLIMFKAATHINALITIHLPHFRVMNYFNPTLIQVRAPKPDIALTDTAESSSSGTSTSQALVGSVFERNIPASEGYLILAAVSSWDYSTGMILGCITSCKEDDALEVQLKRLEPFLFWHKGTKKIQSMGTASVTEVVAK